MTPSPDEITAKLQEIEALIAGLEKALDGPALDAALAPLLEKRAQYRVQAQNVGIIGDAAHVEGDIHYHQPGQTVENQINVGGNYTHTELPPEVLAMFARQFGFDPEASDATALQTYFRHVIFERHGLLSFQFVEPKTGKVYTPANIEDVFVSLRLTNPEASHRADGTKLHRNEIFGARIDEETGEDALVALPDLLNRYDCFLMRGKPGSGKTTLLRHIALAFARGEQAEKLGWTGPVPLPLLVSLRNFGAFLQCKNREGVYLGPQPRALLEYLEEFLRGAQVRFSPEFLPQRLEGGQCILLLDALDEVSGELRDGGDLRAAVARQVAAFIQHYRPLGNRFVLTSRPRAYQDSGEMRQALPQPQVCDVLDLDRQSYQQLIHNLLAVLTRDPAKSAREAADLIKRVAHNQQLTELISNPLLCTTLVLVYKYHGRRLPERRVDVLDEVVTLLLGRLEGERRYLSSPDALAKAGTMARTTERAIEFRRRALVDVAWAMQMASQAEIAGTAVEEVLASFYCKEERATEDEAIRWAEEFLSIAHERSGLFIAIDEGLHTFAHQAFREYFAATHLVYAGEERLISEVLKHAPQPDDWWQQVLLLAGAHPRLSPGAAGRLIERLMGDGVLDHVELAARFAQDMTDKLPGPQRKPLQDWLVNQMLNPENSAKVRARAGRALALTDDPRRGVGLREDGLPDIEWVDIPAGLFLMGSADEDQGADGAEKPQHEVLLAEYQISKYPVTQTQYAAFVQAGGYDVAQYWREAEKAGYWREGQVKGPWDAAWRSAPEDYGGAFSLANHPVVGVMWYEALAYCRWLSEVLGKKIELPSEAEWEKAARGTEALIYPWGAEPDPERANCDETGIGNTSAVGCFPGGISPYGCLEMAGNVWEWTRSIKQGYPYKADDGREDLAGESSRVLRGGAFLNDPRYARCAYRHWNLPNNHDRLDGFRIVVSPSRL